MKYIFFTILGALILTSCEDIIQLELDDTTPRIVIEATINMTAQTATVQMTTSNSFYESTRVLGVSNALIKLENEAGESFTLLESNAGLYFSDNVISQPNEKWTLTIESKGEIYTASAIVPYPATLDTLIAEIENRPFGNEPEVRMSAEWQDQANVPNYYRLRPYRNDTLVTQSYTMIKDQFSDGNKMRTPIFEEFKLGNKVRIQLISSDDKYYRYFSELSSVISNGFNSSTPYNPIGNFDNDAIGYFGIFSVSEKEIQL